MPYGILENFCLKNVHVFELQKLKKTYKASNFGFHIKMVPQNVVIRNPFDAGFHNSTNLISANRKRRIKMKFEEHTTCTNIHM